MPYIIDASLIHTSLANKTAKMPDYTAFFGIISKETNIEIILSLAKSQISKTIIIAGQIYKDMDYFYNLILDFDAHLVIAGTVKDKLLTCGDLSVASQANTLYSQLSPITAKISGISAQCFMDAYDVTTEGYYKDISSAFGLRKFSNQSLQKVLASMVFYENLINPKTCGTTTNPDAPSANYANRPIAHARIYAEQVFLYYYDVNQYYNKIHSAIESSYIQLAAANDIMSKILDLDDEKNGNNSFRNTHKEPLAEVKTNSDADKIYHDKCEQNTNLLLYAAQGSCISQLLQADIANMHDSGLITDSIPQSESTIYNTDNLLQTLKKRADNLLYKIFYGKFIKISDISQDDANAIVAFSGDKVTEKDIANAGVGKTVVEKTPLIIVKPLFTVIKTPLIVKDTSVADKAAMDKALADQAKADKAASDKILADIAIANKAAADKILADKALADKAAADKLIADGKLTEAAAAKKLADQAILDKIASDKKVADQAILDKIDVDKELADKALADKATADKALADKAASDNSALNAQIDALNKKAANAAALLADQKTDLQAQLNDNTAKSDADKKALTDQIAAQNQSIADTKKALDDLTKKLDEANKLKADADALKITTDASLLANDKMAQDAGYKNYQDMLFQQQLMVTPTFDPRLFPGSKGPVWPQSQSTAPAPKKHKTALLIGAAALTTVVVVAVARSGK